MNTMFFHRSASIHKWRNTIDNIQDDNNVKLYKLEHIGNWVMAYFSNSYQEEQREFREEDRQWLIESMPMVILAEENEELV